MISSNRVTIPLQTDVPPGTSSHELAWEAPSDATVERIVVWAEPGSETALKLRPSVRRDGGQYTESDDLPRYPENGNDYITGEPDDLALETMEAIEDGEEIVVFADNDSSQYSYKYRVLATVDFAGGTTDRLAAALEDASGDVESVLSRLSGVSA